jgi:UDPglucose 6-dehydrogenase
VNVILHDPYVKEWDMPSVAIKQDIIDAARELDCLALVTKHAEYFSMDLDEIESVMRTPTIVDGRNVFDQDIMADKDFEYRCVGKGGARCMQT